MQHLTGEGPETQTLAAACGVQTGLCSHDPASSGSPREGTGRGINSPAGRDLGSLGEATRCFHLRESRASGEAMTSLSGALALRI